MTNIKFAFGILAISVVIAVVYAFSLVYFVESLDADTSDSVSEVPLDQVIAENVWDMLHQPDDEARWDSNPVYLKCDVVPVHIIDGDTFQAVTETIISPSLTIKEITSFRLLGVNTPERGKPGYEEAKKFLQKRIGRRFIKVILKTGVGKKRDSFGRFLVDVYLCTDEGNTYINEEILTKKLGEVYKR